jgi:hypothetical protein
VSTDDAGRELARIQKWNLVVWAAATGLAAWIDGADSAKSVGLGGAVGAANFWLTAQVIRRTFVASGEDEAGPSGGLLVLKFVGLFAAVGGALWFFQPDSLGFGLGFCTVLVAIVVKTVADLVMQKDEQDDDRS